MSDFEQLKPCPFCGGQPNEGSVGSSVPGMEDDGYLYIECPNCNGASGKPFIGVHGDDKEVLRGIWNTRAAIASMRGEAKFDLSACLSSVADMGFWPQVIYDDNGNWAIWDEGSSNMRLDDDMDYHCSFLIPAEYFRPSLQEAWSFYVERLKELGNDVSKLYTHAPDSAARIAELESENEALHTTMMAAAVEIQEHWNSHCDNEGYGPANLMHRFERGIADKYGYDAKTVVNMEAEIARLQKELEGARKKAARYDWIEKQANRGATNCGQVLNQNLLNGHRHKNRLMYSFLIRADNASESVDMPLSEAIDAVIRQIGGAE